jgi:hypothetical protein
LHPHKEETTKIDCPANPCKIVQTAYKSLERISSHKKTTTTNRKQKYTKTHTQTLPPFDPHREEQLHATVHKTTQKDIQEK